MYSEDEIQDIEKQLHHNIELKKGTKSKLQLGISLAILFAVCGLYFIVNDMMITACIWFFSMAVQIKTNFTLRATLKTCSKTIVLLEDIKEMRALNAHNRRNN